MRGLKLHGYSLSTIDVYARAVRHLASFYDCVPDQLSVEQLEIYFATLLYQVAFSCKRRGFCPKVEAHNFDVRKHLLVSDWLGEDENIHEVVRIQARVQVKAEEDVEVVDAGRRQESQMEYRHEAAGSATGAPDPGAAEAAHDLFVREGRKVGRNEPCPYGSGNKYKHCHGKLT